MKASLASASAETWNQKNLPTSVEEYEYGDWQSRLKGVIQELPGVAKEMIRRQPEVFIAAAAVLAVFGIRWLFFRND